MRWPQIQEKLMSPREAVEQYVKPGSQVALGGFTITRNPMALVYEIVRQRVRDLHLVCHSNGQALDVLVGAGCVSRLEIAYAGNGRFAPTCVRFRKAVEAGTLEFEDYSNYQMSLRFLAGALSIPFIPSRSGFGTDLLNKEGFSAETRKGGKAARAKYAVLENPFGDGEDRVLLLPALNPDVTLLHAQQVGEDGTVRIRGLTFADLEQAKSAATVIVSCEEIVPISFIRADPDRNSLPPFLIDAIVPVPYGAHPTACPYVYDYDPEHLYAYRRAAEADERFEQYLREWIFAVPAHEAYLDKIGGARLAAIRASSTLGFAPGLDRRDGGTNP